MGVEDLAGALAWGTCFMFSRLDFDIRFLLKTKFDQGRIRKHRSKAKPTYKVNTCLSQML